MRRNKKKSWNVYYVLIALILIVLSIYFYSSNQVQTISQIKSEQNIGKSVTISGEVKNVFKIGELSGYFLEDESDRIRVSSESLPTEGETKKVRGVLMRDSLLGYYIKVD